MSIEIAIPGWKNLCLETVLFDLNGTLACDGRIAASTRERLVALAKHVAIYVMSADTHGTLERETAGLPVHVSAGEQVNAGRIVVEIAPEADAKAGAQ